ncbi:uncharacterized protein LOC102788691 [Neolamprologus brichardi]|uniref:uncharacterized protein LOC102788691 n=1 Tax=Neolamprologus brichardi TaxID=32507 RepID=UPI001643E822|nr:uncharacterized protein LOC102788691 [Neolamprologus brichardi]
MACASQSALDYVRSARDHLVRTLKGFTEIVENLSTRGFFSEEEVNKIKSESDGFDKTRRIVDYVIEMGEEACYEFLRIIDTTRRTSGERSLSFAENPESSSSLSNMFDLNYWISCFSFREDINIDVTSLQGPSPCHRYQQKLKSEAQKISERSWTQSKAVLLNKQSSLSYISLVLDTPGQASPSKIKKSKIKKSRKLRPKKLKTYIPEDKHGISPSELLKTYERKIILVGKPGTGKTAVVHQMLKLWSEKDNRDLDYMFYFDMRETPNITELHKLEDLLFSVFCEPDEGNDEVLEDIKNNADSVTIIFDGFTDVGSTSVVFKLIQKTLLPEAKIIVTCRPEVESADFLLDWDCLRVEVKGFSEQGIREYLSKNLSEDHFNKVLCNLELFSLCHVPMYALMVVACFSFEGSNFSPHPCTVTEIYLHILHFCNQRNVSKTPENESTKWDAIMSLSQAAFCATEGKNVNLTSLPKLDSCEVKLVLITRDKNCYKRSDPLSCQLWSISLLTDGDVDYVSLLDFTENQLHLPVNSKTQLYDRAVRVLQKRKRKVKVCLHCDHRVCQSASSFLLHHLPHIHSLSFCQSSGNLSDQTELLMNLFIGAAERDQRTGEKILNMLSSVCSYQTFPLHSNSNDKYQSDFLLDLYSHVKDCETKTGLSVLPSLQVELTGCSHEESEVRSLLQCLPYISQLSSSVVPLRSDPDEAFRIFMSLFCAAAEREQQTGEKILELLASVCTYQTLLQCLPYISQLSCDPEFFQSVCTSMSVRSREEAQQLESLLQLLGFQLLLTGALHRKSCWSVGRALQLCGSKVDLILTPSKMSARGGALLFRHTTQLHSLRLSIDMSLLLSQWVRRGRAACRLAVEELSLMSKKAPPSHRVLLRAVSSLASLLRYWTVGRLDLTETCIPAQGLVALLLHDGPLTVKLSEESFQQVLSLLHGTQDKDLTLSFLSKVGGDLTSCCLSWELLHYLLQQPSAQTITVDLRKNLFLQEETTRLLPFLDGIVFKRPSPSFVMSFIRELYRAHDSHAVPSLLRSLGHVINLSCRQLDSVDCAALIFILKHGDGVRLNLLWTSIPAGGVESILLMLDNVSHLRSDIRARFSVLHCAIAEQHTLLDTVRRAVSLCTALGGELDLSHSTLDQRVCGALVQMLDSCEGLTELDLSHCQLTDQLLLPLVTHLHKVQVLDLSHNQITDASTDVLLQLLSINPSINCVRLFSNNIVHRAAFKEHIQFEIW